MVQSSLSLTERGNYWRQSGCRKISRWHSATTGEPICPQSGTKLSPPRCRCSSPQTPARVTNTTTLADSLVEECDQDGDQHEEEVPGSCTCVWFTHMLLTPLFVRAINSSMANMSFFPRLQTSNPSFLFQVYPWPHCGYVGAFTTAALEWEGSY